MTSLKKLIKETDWILLIFLFLITNQAIFIFKIIGLIFIYVVRPNFKFGFLKGRIPKFYLFIIILSFINLFIHISDYSKPYIAAFTVGNLFWLACFLSHHQLKLSVEKYGANALHSTLKTFTIINFIFCISQIGRIILITTHLNPYRNLDFPYGMSTGDNVFGFFMESSLYNMMICTMLAIYFLFKKDILFFFLATTSFVLVFSNLGTIIYLGVICCILLVYLFTSKQKKYAAQPVNKVARFFYNITPPFNYSLLIPLNFLFIILIYNAISKDNFDYTTGTIKSFLAKKNTSNALELQLSSSIDSDIQVSSLMKKYLQTNKKGNVFSNKQKKYAILSSSDQPQKDTGMIRAKEQITQYYINALKGKQLSFLETYLYLQSSPLAFLFGAGPTRFSSQLTQRMAGIDSSRFFKKYLPAYSSHLYDVKNYEQNCTKNTVFAQRLASGKDLYSNANWANSFYNQLLGEYGILGAILFIVFYIGYFVKRVKCWTYGFWISIMLLPFAVLSYMFEPLSVMLFYELLMALEIENNKAIV